MEIIGYGGLFISMGVTIGQFLKNYGILNLKYKRLEHLQVSTPQQLVEEIEKELSQNLVASNLSFIRKNQVFIEGVISSNHLVKSVLVQGLEVLYSLFYQKELFTRREFSKNAFFPLLLPENEKKIIQIASNLFLKDYESPQVCDIQKKPNTNIQAALELLQMKAHLVKRGFLSNFLHSIIDFTKLLLTITYLKLSYLKKKGTYEGTLDVEMGLKNNSLVTIFGDIIYDVRNKKLVMENPLYILKDKEQLLKLLQKRLMQRRIFILILSIPFLIGGFMFLKKLIEVVQKYIQIKRDKLITHLREKMDLIAQDKNIGDNQKCNICYSNLRNIILKPCLHMCLCYSCLKRIKKQECPICKAEIISYIELFLK
ncbi:hypothetical protein ABPG74_012984 [Tetrahymena malaccensis]